MTPVHVQKRVYEETTGTPAADSVGDVSRDRLDAIRDLYERDRLAAGDLVYLLAVLDGAKPGASISDAAVFSGEAAFPGVDDLSWVADNPVYRLVEALDLPRKVVVTCYAHDVGGLHVYAARDGEHLDLCPAFEDESRQTSDIECAAQPEYGAFLGVPEPDRVWWRDRGRGIEAVDDATPLCEVVDRTVSARELRAAKQIPYCPEPTVAGVERGIGVGQQYVAATERFDEAVAGTSGERAVDEQAEFDSFWT